jgi:hypothetical protein
VTSIETWWKRMGSKRYPDANEIFITADAGGSNAYRTRVWQFELQRLADKLRLPIHVSHFPPGTSKWNKVEHRLFSFITMNWRGKPLRTSESVVSLIGNMTNSGGLVVKASIVRNRSPAVSNGQEDHAETNARAQDRNGRLPRRLELHDTSTRIVGLIDWVSIRGPSARSRFHQKGAAPRMERCA